MDYPDNSFSCLGNCSQKEVVSEGVNVGYAEVFQSHGKWLMEFSNFIIFSICGFINIIKTFLAN